MVMCGSVNGANEKRLNKSTDEQTETEALSHLQGHPLNSDGKSHFRRKRRETER